MRSLLRHDWAKAYEAHPGVYISDAAGEIVDHLDRLYSGDLALTQVASACLWR